MNLGIIVFDIIQFLLYSFLIGIAFYPITLLTEIIINNLSIYYLPFFAVGLIYLFFVTLILELWFLRLVLPKLKTGYYDTPNSKMFYIWTLNFTFSRMLFNDPVRNLILYFASLRFLAINALGGKVSLLSAISANVSLVDIPMLSIGKGGMIGAWSVISGHFMVNGKIGLGKVVIGDNVNIGAHTHIGPNVTIGNNVVIGVGCKISPLVEIGEGCIIEPLSVIPSGTRLEKGETFPLKN